jgi:hypothetical protein
MGLGVTSLGRSVDVWFPPIPIRGHSSSRAPSSCGILTLAGTPHRCPMLTPRFSPTPDGHHSPNPGLSAGWPSEQHQQYGASRVFIGLLSVLIQYCCLTLAKNLKLHSFWLTQNLEDFLSGGFQSSTPSTMARCYSYGFTHQWTETIGFMQRVL